MPVAVRPEFSVYSCTCRPESSRWTPEAPAVDGRLVLVRSGRFRRRSRAGVVEHDSTVGYLHEPGDDEYFAHPHAGDVCTSIQLSAECWWQLVGEPGRVRRSAVYIDARLELAHRRMLAAGCADVDYQLAEQLLTLAATALRQTVDRQTPLGDPPAEARVVERARAAIHDDHPAAGGLFSLAGLLNTSPYRLSRAFPRQLGISLTRYRNRVRVGRALAQLQVGTAALADVAADLGFADQAHFSRVMREHLGATPGALRAALTTSPNRRRALAPSG